MKDFVKLNETMLSKGITIKDIERNHYARLLLLLLSDEDFALEKIENEHKLLCHKWTFYLAMEKYMSMYPHLFLPGRHYYIPNK